MVSETIAQLRKISTPKVFSKDDYICYEGQPGSEMYIILKGSIGIFLTSAIGTLTQVATIKEGDFFGEMAIFDNLPRSASCIAMEDTICVAVDKENLQEFLATCPDIAKQMLENMSGRIRKLDDELYKNNRFVKNRHVPRFQIPTEYKYHPAIKEPFQNPDYFIKYKQACPICGKAITVTDVKRNLLQMRSMDLDCKITYFQCEPLWYEIMTCPYCYYTNHYLKFFGINNFEQEVVQRILEKEQKPIVEARMDKSSEFDYLVTKYIQAIHLNENINPGANALIGGMWRNLYWLSRDLLDKEFVNYCAKKAAEKLKIAIEENEIFSATSKAATALSLASLMSRCGGSKDIPQYVAIALDCPDETIKEKAQIVKERLDKILQRK